jgi:hypothetical protein
MPFTKSKRVWNARSRYLTKAPARAEKVKLAIPDASDATKIAVHRCGSAVIGHHQSTRRRFAEAAASSSPPKQPLARHAPERANPVPNVTIIQLCALTNVR